MNIHTGRLRQGTPAREYLSAEENHAHARALRARLMGPPPKARPVLVVSAPILIAPSAPVDHDDHCTLTFRGVNWHILQMRGPGRIAIEALAPDAGWVLLDLSQADLGAYTDRAADWLRPDMAISNAEVLA